MGAHDGDSRFIEREIYVIELDDRLEFGAAIIDSDLEADNNSGCGNTSSCKSTNDTSCTNSSGTCSGTNTTGCSNTGTCK